MMRAPEGEGFSIRRMPLKYADWNQGVNACGSILPEHLDHRAAVVSKLGDSVSL